MQYQKGDKLIPPRYLMNNDNITPKRELVKDARCWVTSDYEEKRPYMQYKMTRLQK